MAIGQTPGNGSSKVETIKRSKEVIKKEIEAKKTTWEHLDNVFNNSEDFEQQKKLKEECTTLLFDIGDLEEELRHAK